MHTPAATRPKIRTPEDLSTYVVSGVTRESAVLEFKENYDERHQRDSKAKRRTQLEVCRDIAQFANASGGCIVIGVEDAADGTGLAGQLVGVEDPDGLLRWIQQAVGNHLVPRPDGLDFARIQTDRGTFVCINVPASRALCAVWDREQGTIQYVRRDVDKKIYMNPDEAITGVLDRSRTTRLALDAALHAAGASGGALHGTLTLVPSPLLLGPVPRNPAHCRVYLSRIHEFGVEVKVVMDWANNTMINIPWELIRAVWPTVEHGKIGIALHARVHVGDSLAWLDM